MPKKRPQPVREKCDKGHELTYANTLRRRKGTYVVRLCRQCRNEYQAERRAVWKERRSRVEDCQCVYCRGEFQLTNQAVKDAGKRGGLLICPSCKPKHRDEMCPAAIKVQDHHRSYWRNHPTLSFAEVVRLAQDFVSWENPR